MNQVQRYEDARDRYAAVGVDTDAAIRRMMEIPVSLHCWQGDDVTGFDHDDPLTGGIQTTGNYPGKVHPRGTHAGYGCGIKINARKKEAEPTCKLCHF